ncbi:MAG: hypothetical protein U0269_31355 [Polyangiales bacterium]
MLSPSRGSLSRSLVFALLSLAGCDAFAPRPTCEGRPRSQCVEDLSVGDGFACAVLRDRSVWCWGRDDDGQLGYSAADLCPVTVGMGQTRSVACHNFPQQVGGISSAQDVVTGASNGCAWGEGMSLQCWGANESGQLGTGTMFSSPNPANVRGGDGASVSVSAGRRHACRVREGRVQCWGANDRGQLGVSNAPDRCNSSGEMISCAREPVTVAGLDSVVEVVAGAAHTCARTDDGSVYCWGDNRFGQAGDEHPGDAPTMAPARVLTARGALFGVVAMAAGASHTCALREDHAVYCWGRNDQGQLGVPVAMSVEMGCAESCSPRAVAVTGFEGMGLPTPSDSGVRTDGAAEASTPVMEAGAPMDASAPPMDASVPARDASAMVDSAPDQRAPMVAPQATQLAAGGEVACVRIDDGTVRCWGSDAHGQLGDGRAGGFSHAPTLVIASPGAAQNNPLQAVEAVRVGGSSVCAKLADRSVRCWGSNEAGALGTGNLSPVTGPVPLSW